MELGLTLLLRPNTNDTVNSSAFSDLCKTVVNLAAVKKVYSQKKIDFFGWQKHLRTSRSEGIIALFRGGRQR